MKNEGKQGRIHGPSCVRVGRASAGEDHWDIWAGAVRWMCGGKRGSLVCSELHGWDLSLKTGI